MQQSWCPCWYQATETGQQRSVSAARLPTDGRPHEFRSRGLKVSIRLYSPQDKIFFGPFQVDTVWTRKVQLDSSVNTGPFICLSHQDKDHVFSQVKRDSGGNDREQRKSLKEWHWIRTSTFVTRDFHIDYEITGWAKWIVYPNRLNTSVWVGREYEPVNHANLQNQSINTNSIVPISPAKSGSAMWQPNQCSATKLRKQFRNINRPSGMPVSMGEWPSQRDMSSNVS